MTNGEALERMKQVIRSCETRPQLEIAMHYSRMLIKKYIGWGLVAQAVYNDVGIEQFQKIQKRNEMAELAMPMPL